jgi:hypothetical protein
LAGHSSIALVLDADPADPHAIPTDDLERIGPLLQAAAILHIPAQVRSFPDVKRNQPSTVPIFVTHRELPGESLRPGDAEAAYITVIPGKHPKLWIWGSTPGAIALAIKSVSSEEAFPQALAMALRRDRPTSIRIAAGEKITVQNAEVSGALWPQ